MYDLHNECIYRSWAKLGAAVRGGRKEEAAKPPVLLLAMLSILEVNPLQLSSWSALCVSNYSVSVSDISGTKSNMLEITISYNLFL